MDEVKGAKNNPIDLKRLPFMRTYCYRLFEIGDRALIGYLSNDHERVISLLFINFTYIKSKTVVMGSAGAGRAGKLTQKEAIHYFTNGQGLKNPLRGRKNKKRST